MLQPNQKLIENRVTRVAVIGLAVVVLVSVYIFQRVSYLGLFTNTATIHPNTVFIFDKTMRLILNDVACFGLIAAIFQTKAHVRIAFYVFLFEIAVILPGYFLIKLSLEGTSEISSPLLSQIHRIVVNPTMMFLLMAGFIYQRFRATGTLK